jgi:hypothetical protein
MQSRTNVRKHLCSELVSVARLSGDRPTRMLDGNLEEIGESSALILLQDAVPIGTKVRVMGKAKELMGRVKSCTFDRVLGYFIEVGLDAQSRWSEKWFIPEHLFTLCPSMRYFTEAGPKVTEKFLLERNTHTLKTAS